MSDTKKRASITTHILDLAQGKAAVGVPVILERLEGNETWSSLASAATNADGRVENWRELSGNLPSGTYRLIFDTQAYHGSDSFYPSVTVQFRLSDPNRHYHVPLLLSPFGYSTYRGT